MNVDIQNIKILSKITKIISRAPSAIISGNYSQYSHFADGSPSNSDQLSPLGYGDVIQVLDVIHLCV